MTIDDKVNLGEKLAEELLQNRFSQDNEWKKWCLYFHKKGLEQAIQLAKSLSCSLTLRPNIQKSYQIVAQVIQKHKKNLSKLSQEDLIEVFGYTTRYLIANRSSTQKTNKFSKKHK